ncbi:MAG: TonB-dependent receptor [Phenylobacterium sp.]|nr:MAG: TonB-dependent receptor [Phenylobacterium sp.]
MAGASPLAFAQTTANPPAPRASAPAAKPPAAKPAKAKKPPKRDPDDDEATLSELVVTGDRPQPGAVVGDIKPELQIGPAEIQSYGVSTVTELLDELAPQIRSDRGRGGEGPVVLLNGRRISGFNEIRDIPTEAILRVDILPEEVALKYGFAANQRVVNIVLRPFFRAWTAEGTAGAPTEGGQVTGQGELDLMRIRRDRRINLDLKVAGATALTEDERSLTSLSAGQPFDPLGNVVAASDGGEIDPALSALAGRPITIAGVPLSAANGQPLSLADFAATAGLQNQSPDLGQLRTLVGSSKSVSANGVYTRPIFAGINATVNATLGATHAETLQGLPSLSLNVPAGDPFSPFAGPVVVDRAVGAFGPLTQTIDGWTAHLGTTFNRDVGKWRFNLTGAYDHADTLTHSDVGVDASLLQARLSALDPTFDPFVAPAPGLLPLLPQDKGRSLSDGLAVHLVASGPSITLPAGQIYSSFRVGDVASWFESDSFRSGFTQSLDFTRNDASAHANIDVPLASRKNNVLAFLGDLSVNGNAAIDQLSDFGALTTLGFGMNWTPITGLNLIVSHTRDQAAPTFQQLGGPVVVTPGVRLFDYATGQTVEVRQINGGNPALTADVRNVTKLGLTWKPISDQDLTITANYIRSLIHNPIETFPAATADIEAAFPDRFVRDAAGQLTEVDVRPVNFAEETRSDLRLGINYSRPLGPEPPPRPQRRNFGGGQRAAGGMPSDGGPGGPGGPDGGGGTGGGDGGPGGPPGGGGGFGGGGGGGRGGGFRGGGGGPGGAGRAAPGRLQFAVYYTVYFEDQYLVRPGGPVFDLLNGSPMGSGGGQPRQEIEVQAGALLHGLGARISANWNSATEVHGAPGTPTGDLSFSDLAKLDLRLFADLGQQQAMAAKYPWVRGVRVTFSVTNLFDARQHVHDATGATPLIYQPAYLDPVGRVAKISLRKLFY